VFLLGVLSPGASDCAALGRPIGHRSHGLGHNRTTVDEFAGTAARRSRSRYSRVASSGRRSGHLVVAGRRPSRHTGDRRRLGCRMTRLTRGGW
jgi:hypothetical protein